MIKPFTIAALSWLFGLLVWGAYEYPTWQCLVNISLVDFIFIIVFYYSDIEDEKVRWICTLLSISVFATLLSSVTFYMYHYGLIEADFFAVAAVKAHYGDLSFVLSLLIMIVSSLNNRIMDKFDGLCWPSFARGFRHNFDVSRRRNLKGGAF